MKLTEGKAIHSALVDGALYQSQEDPNIPKSSESDILSMTISMEGDKPFLSVIGLEWRELINVNKHVDWLSWRT